MAEDAWAALNEVVRPQLAELQQDVALLQEGVNHAWLLFGAAVVFAMQAGFALLEAGTVRSGNVANIMFKNAMDGVISAVAFWLVGWTLYMGPESRQGFVGWGDAWLERQGRDGMSGWLFQWAFAATASTIVSGAVAERCRLGAFFTYAAAITGVVYPVVAHWAWSPHGWASPFNKARQFGTVGVLDFAGSGVVHMTGGCAALAAAAVLGPRRGLRAGSVHAQRGRRFDPGVDDTQFRPHNVLLQALGTFILWFGWYGFNCVSTLAIAGGGAVAAKVAATTTLGGAAGGLSALVLNQALRKRLGSARLPWDVGALMNGILGGLVSITAGCAVVDPWGALAIGVAGGGVYTGAASALRHLHIDDPLEAFPVHGACGFWGLLAAGVFATDKNLASAYGVETGVPGEQSRVQLAFALCVVAWAGGTASVLFAGLDACGVFRVPPAHEDEGLDAAEGMGGAYSSDFLAHRDPPAFLSSHAVTVVATDVPTEAAPDGATPAFHAARGALMDRHGGYDLGAGAAAFASPAAAAAFALELQEALLDVFAGAPAPRAGVHTGAVGPARGVAAQVRDVGCGGQVLVTGTAYAAALPVLGGGRVAYEGEMCTAGGVDGMEVISLVPAAALVPSRTTQDAQIAMPKEAATRWQAVEAVRAWSVRAHPDGVPAPTLAEALAAATGGSPSDAPHVFAALLATGGAPACPWAALAEVLLALPTAAIIRMAAHVALLPAVQTNPLTAPVRSAPSDAPAGGMDVWSIGSDQEPDGP